MKRFIFIISMLLLFIHWQYGMGAGRLRIVGLVDNMPQVDNRKAYLFITYDNQASILDSCIIHQGKFELKGFLPYDEVSAEVIIEQVPASSGPIIVSQNETVHFVFHPLGQMKRPKVSGAKSHEELYNILNNSDTKNRNRLAVILRSLSKMDPKFEQLKDSLDYYNAQQKNRYEELLHQTKSGFNAIYAFFCLMPHLSEYEQQKIKQYIVTTFPNNVNLSMITGTTNTGNPIPESTLDSKKAFNFYARTIGDLPPFPEIEMNTSSVLRNNDTNQVISKSGNEKVVILERTSGRNNNQGSKIYRLNDVVSDFSLPSIKDSQNLQLSDLKSDYVLIDFWASWCAPCLTEIPYLKTALEKSEDKLSIFSISIDQNLYQWENAIVKNEMQMFAHAILRKDHPQFNELKRLFDIQTIPINFLLDRNRRVIAINLRGEELQKTLRQLLSEE